MDFHNSAVAEAVPPPPHSKCSVGSEESCARAYLNLEEIKRENEEIRKELLELRRRRLEAMARREMMFERKMMLRDACSVSHVADDIERSVRLPDPGSPAMVMQVDVPRSDLHQPQHNCASDTLLRDKDRVVVLPKPDPILVGANKRKAERELAALISTDSPMAHLAKKPKGRWGCDLCKVSAPSEKGFSDHLHGRKHRLMKAQIRGKEIETGLTKVGESEEAQVRGGQMEVCLAKDEETGTSYVHKAGTGPSEEAFKKATRKTIVKTSAPSHGIKAGHAMNAASKKKRYKYWCRICRIGSDSPVVFASHEKGKKHLAQLLELGKPNNTN